MTGASESVKSDRRPVHGLALVAITLGVAGVVWPGLLALFIANNAGAYADDMTTWILFGLVSLPPAVLAIVLGSIAVHATSRSAAEYRGTVIAWIGIALGAVGTVAWTAVMIAGIAQP